MTPDSFSGDGVSSAAQGFKLAQKLIADGADILDIGGESSRPGSKRISVQEELERVIPLIKKLTKVYSIPISVDTYKPQVAQMALEAGASIVNTIKGVDPDKTLLKIIKRYNAGIVLMHMQGSPRTMQKNIKYTNLMKEISDSLRESIEICLEIGINSDKIIVDPGIGFGKTVEHNLEIINRLDTLKTLKMPILIGPSRKSFIGKILKNEVEDRLAGTIAAVCASIVKGAHIVRVHDVRAVKQASLLTDAIINQGMR